MSEENSFRVEPAEKPDDFQAMLVGAALVFVVSVIPFVNLLGCCLIPQVLGAMLAVYWFTNKYQLTISPGKGIVLGILTCLLGGIAAFIISMILQKLGINPVEEFTNQTIIDLVEKYAPDMADQVREQIERQKLEGLGAVQIVIGLVFSLVFNAVGGLIGGAIGAAVFKKAPPATPAAPVA
ncbi:MAG: DUF4199 family protein [Verrucomicrobia bacterium]|nr:DUF4199 family protein [Verrucomicrobiota bacterium]